MLRGDGCLTKTTKSGNSQLQIWQKSKEFVEHLWILLSTIGIVGALPYTLERFDSRTGQTYTATHFATFGLPFFGALFHEWYSNISLACCLFFLMEMAVRPNLVSIFLLFLYLYRG